MYCWAAIEFTLIKQKLKKKKNKNIIVIIITLPNPQSHANDGDQYKIRNDKPYTYVERSVSFIIPFQDHFFFYLIFFCLFFFYFFLFNFYTWLIAWAWAYNNVCLYTINTIYCTWNTHQYYKRESDAYIVTVQVYCFLNCVYLYYDIDWTHLSS